MPNAPPSRPPIASAGAKSPALPPEPIVKLDATIFTQGEDEQDLDRRPSRPAASSAPVIATWAAP